MFLPTCPLLTPIIYIFNVFFLVLNRNKSGHLATNRYNPLIAVESVCPLLKKKWVFAHPKVGFFQFSSQNHHNLHTINTFLKTKVGKWPDILVKVGTNFRSRIFRIQRNKILQYVVSHTRPTQNNFLAG